MIKDPELLDWYRSAPDHRRNSLARILDVNYAHLQLDDGADLYLTRSGLPFLENLRPENFLTDESWFWSNAVRLEGTSTLYRVTTKPVGGRQAAVVLKWNRMGQDIPGQEHSDQFASAAFNSPFEEFSLVTALREAALAHYAGRIAIQKPLGIYVPSERVELWQTGRKEYVMQSKLTSHTEVPLDMFRSYAVIYEWIDGLDAVQAAQAGLLTRGFIAELTADIDKKIQAIGYHVRDSKPHHIIVRPRRREGGGVLRRKDGGVVCALVDFELLERTPEKATAVKKEKRAAYLKRQTERFAESSQGKFRPHIADVNIFGVDYVYGKVESTEGRLWVVGRDPYLFDYFLPERWEHVKKTKLSDSKNLFDLVTEDNVRLICEISDVGLFPPSGGPEERERTLRAHGRNSPFEEVSFAFRLTQKGIPTIYPRAIYMTGARETVPPGLLDESRYRTHAEIRTPDGFPVLERGREYLIFWGFWNGPDEKLAANDADYYVALDARRAFRQNLITRPECDALVRGMEEKLAGAGVRALDLDENSLLLSFDPARQTLVRGARGQPEVRLRNFGFFKNLEAGGPE